jgi:hypothetical protein
VDICIYIQLLSVVGWLAVAEPDCGRLLDACAVIPILFLPENSLQIPRAAKKNSKSRNPLIGF